MAMLDAGKTADVRKWQTYGAMSWGWKSRANGKIGANRTVRFLSSSRVNGNPSTFSQSRQVEHRRLSGSTETYHADRDIFDPVMVYFAGRSHRADRWSRHQTIWPFFNQKWDRQPSATHTDGRREGVPSRSMRTSHRGFTPGRSINDKCLPHPHGQCIPPTHCVPSSRATTNVLGGSFSGSSSASTYTIA